MKDIEYLTLNVDKSKAIVTDADYWLRSVSAVCATVAEAAVWVLLQFRLLIVVLDKRMTAVVRFCIYHI
jgi:hypothetical protein